MKITINAIVFTLVFDYACLRELSKLWGLKGVGEVSQKLASGETDEMDGIVDLAFASIKSSGQPGAENVTLADVGNYFLTTPNSVGEAVAQLIDSFPKAEPEGKHHAATDSLQNS